MSEPTDQELIDQVMNEKNMFTAWPHNDMVGMANRLEAANERIEELEGRVEALCGEHGKYHATNIQMEVKWNAMTEWAKACEREAVAVEALEGMKNGIHACINGDYAGRCQACEENKYIDEALAKIKAMKGDTNEPSARK